MRKFISLNSSMELFLSYVFIIIVEVLLMPFLLLIAPQTVSTIAMSFALGHIALVSQAFEKTMNGTTVNYLLSEGVGRKEIFKSILIKYLLSVVLVSVFVSLFIYKTHGNLMYFYTLYRIVFGIAFSFLFMNQFFEADPRLYFVIPIYMTLNTGNPYYSIIMSIPISIYLYLRFKKKVLEGNLV